jgi:hypothetical protein
MNQYRRRAPRGSCRGRIRGPRRALCARWGGGHGCSRAAMGLNGSARCAPAGARSRATREPAASADSSYSSHELSPMKSRPRMTSATFLIPPTTGVKSSAVSTVPRRAPLRRIAAPRVASARTLPTQGAARSSRLVTRRCPNCSSCRLILIPVEVARGVPSIRSPSCTKSPQQTEDSK